MTELGNLLKEARLEKGMSLDDLQAATKIQKRYLLGIEEGNYATMPGNFYVRAFIKQYAEALQLNSDEIFETYKNDIPATYNDDLPEKLSRVKTRKTFSERGSKVFDLLPKVLITVVVIGVVALVYYFMQNYARTNTNESANNQNAPVNYVKSKNLDQADANANNSKNKQSNTQKDTNKTQNANQPDSSAQVISPGKISGGNHTTYQVTNANKFVVKLVSRASSWVSIKNSKGALQFQGVLKAGGTNTQTVDLSNDTAAVIRIGNASVTDIFVNDQKINYTIPPNQVTVQNIMIQYVPKNK